MSDTARMINDPIDNGTFINYHDLVMAIVNRALRDADPRKVSIPTCDYRDAWSFLEAPPTIEFCADWGLNLEWLKGKFEQLVNGK